MENGLARRLRQRREGPLVELHDVCVFIVGGQSRGWMDESEWPLPNINGTLFRYCFAPTVASPTVTVPRPGKVIVMPQPSPRICSRRALSSS